MAKKNKNDSIESVMKQMMVRKSPSITMDDAAELLKDNPEMLKLFEEKYTESLENRELTNGLITNSKKAAAIINKRQKSDLGGQNNKVNQSKLDNLIDTIANDLLAITSTLSFNGDLDDDNNIQYKSILKPVDGIVDHVIESLDEDLKVLPKDIKPQLTANRVIKDLGIDTGLILLEEYKKAVENIGTSEGMLAYHRFRQGLDILDIDDITYELLSNNRNSMGHWLPQLIEACKNQTFFKIPRTTIAKLPPTLLQLTKLEYNSINQTTRKILNKWTEKAFNLVDSGDYFIKTGVYSFKFDFRNVRVKDSKEIKELGEYLLYIHSYANQCAGPLFNPCIYGMSTTNEWVVREFIESKEEAPTIYNGLPLHVEYRAFIDCDTHEILSIHPYWDPDGMKEHFSKYAKNGNINHIHDYVVFKSYEDKMIKKYSNNKDEVVKHLQPIVDKLNLTGQWSLDIMDDGEKYWLIDMAVAEQSTFYESVPKEKRRPVLEQWLPGIKPVMPPWFNDKAISMASIKPKSIGNTDKKN